MNHYPNVSSWKHDVFKRYEGGACGTSMAQTLGQLYTNWHVHRTDEVNGIRGVKQRLKFGALANIDAIEHTIQEVRFNFTRNIREIRYLLNNVSDKKVGMLVGLNCKVLMEEGLHLKDAICVKCFNTLYGLLVATTTCALGLLALTCLLACIINSFPQS